MLFSSAAFLYSFLPLTIAVYFLMPRRLKNAALLLMSLIFYAWGEPRYVVLMVLSITQGYIFARLIGKSRGTKRAKAYLIISLVLSLGMLGVFKYANFFAESFAAVFGLKIAALNIALPIGISFYTFQLISYVIDVYRADVEPQRDYVAFAAYISMFPQLIAGPIVRYSDIEAELTARAYGANKAAYGARRFILGLGKKVLIANVLAELVNAFKASGEKSTLFYWVYAAAYMLHVYFDFSGYSDMAIGLGSIFGFTFPENFNYPYIAASITEFWRRWHMSLSSWFRDYVYIPLGGNRVSPRRHLFNLLVVWLLTGVWHGADWAFIFWGLGYFLLLMAEKYGHIDQKLGFLRRPWTLFWVLMLWVLFRAENLGKAVEYFTAMFTGGRGDMQDFIYYFSNMKVYLLAAMVCCLPLGKLWRKVPELWRDRLESLGTVALMAVLVTYVVGSTYNPFIYFNF